MSKKGKGKIPQQYLKDQITQHEAIKCTEKEIKINSLVSGKVPVLKMNPYVALKYFQSDWQCFSDWEADELKAFSSFLTKLQNVSWAEVYKTASGIPKHGLAYTKYKIENIKSIAIKNKLVSVQKKISEDIDFFELRVNQDKLRVHGFQSQSVFFLVALDNKHEAFPSK